MKESEVSFRLCKLASTVLRQHIEHLITHLFFSLSQILSVYTYWPTAWQYNIHQLFGEGDEILKSWEL